VSANQMIVQGYARQLAKIFQEPDTALGATCQRATMEEIDLMPFLAGISAPALVVHGENDRLVPVEAARTIAKAIPGSRLEVFPGAGHLLLIEAPRRLYEIIGAFLRTVP
jgi:pimeloyl-ACP methyl ester carboxylesterase